MRRLIVTAAIVVMTGCHNPTGYKQPAVDSFVTSQARIQIGATLIEVRAAHVTQNFFPATGVQPLLGRLFLDGESASSPTRAIVLGHELWTARFDSSPGAVGRTIEFDGHPAVIVGVLPEDFGLPEGTQVWTPQ
jgi:hypothetical protein